MELSIGASILTNENITQGVGTQFQIQKLEVQYPEYGIA
jgi:hypothetical protein